MEGFFLDSSVDALQQVAGTHNSWLVALSILVAIFSASMALQTTHIARASDLPLHRQIAIGTGSFALGGGIWTMHFIGMLSFELCTTVQYDPGLTLLSILPGWAASWVALQILARPRVSTPHLILGGVLVGAGIGTMHYSGMAAMQMAPQLRYDPIMFALSLVVAVGLAILSLWIRFRLLRTRLTQTQRLVVAGTVMGLAISGMHYTGMAAARVIGMSETPQIALVFNSTFVSVMLSTFTITLTVFVTAANGLLRYRQLYRKMEDSESRMRAVVETAVDGILTIDGRGIIQAFNPSAERLFGWHAREVIGRNIKMLMPEPDQSRHDSYLSNYLRSGEAKIIGSGREVTGLRKDGSLIPMRLAVGQVDLPGEALFVGFVSDITQRKELESSLRVTAARAEQAATAKSTFLATMSHEIRTPMNAIIGFTELLLKSEMNALQRSHLNTVRQSARSLLALLNDILDTTKLERGTFLLESLDFSLKAVAEQVIASLRLSAQARDLTLTLDYPADMPPFYKGDPLRLQQVLTNLLGNALKFTEQGQVTLRFAPLDGMVHIQVSDTGIGMTSEQADRIFEPFVQADASISRRFGGTGLGTTIVRQLVELMGGSIRVESEIGLGSTFHVLLPLRLGAPPEPARADSDSMPLPPLSILAADDVPQNLELLTLILRDGGHRITMARDGNEALTRFGEQRYDVVLMDVHMPGTDGLDAARHIRQREQAQGLAPTPIIALTASVMDSDRRAARQAGMDGFAVKPVDAPRLIAEIARVLAGERLPAQGARNPSAQGQATRKAIDWPAGIALWGSAPRLARAIEGFLAQQPERHPLPKDTEISPDGAEALESLHGLRGAAGNLGMTVVADIAAQLELRIRGGQREDLGLHIEALRQALAEAGAALQASPALAEARQQPPPSPCVPRAEVRARVDELLDCVNRGELNDAALEAVCEHLRASGEPALCHTLRDALDSFEFDDARKMLHTLQDRLDRDDKDSP
ncbi:diguanylate cyclase/phosphodiesterase (GGDEF & EAL domains) with PAS/PAC sensor(s) [plant metagenome]|uniref:histidine kinase n=1 Tax=plant metagenome TaxID=1297885 RepID=A0A484V5M5_9ZZZZ